MKETSLFFSWVMFLLLAKNNKVLPLAWYQHQWLGWECAMHYTHFIWSYDALVCHCVPFVGTTGYRIGAFPKLEPFLQSWLDIVLHWHQTSLCVCILGILHVGNHQWSQSKRFIWKKIMCLKVKLLFFFFHHLNRDSKLFTSLWVPRTHRPWSLWVAEHWECSLNFLFVGNFKIRPQDAGSE